MEATKETALSSTVSAYQTIEKGRRLTSQWSGRHRAAHFGAAHRRVRRQIQKRFVDFSHNQFAIGWAPVEEANVFHDLFYWRRT